MTTDELDQGFMTSLVKSYAIDFLIMEILDDGKEEYNELSYSKKIAICNLYGRVIA